MIFAIDPGPEESAFVFYADCTLGSFGKVPNVELLEMIHKHKFDITDTLVLEMIASYGMPVGSEVFETCVWIGRFSEAWGPGVDRVYRQQVKLHLCGQARAKDANIRQALIDRFGPGKERAIGNKKAPGPLYGVTADVWAALAVAVTYADTQGVAAANRGAA
jgi:hypothetical protein